MKKLIIEIIALAFLVVCIVAATRHFFGPLPPSPISDSNYVDTLLQDHSQLPNPPADPITSDTATPETRRIYDSLVKKEGEKP